MAVSQDFIGSTQLGQVQAVTSSQIAATNAYLAALTKAATEILPPPINLPPSNITPANVMVIATLYWGTSKNSQDPIEQVTYNGQDYAQKAFVFRDKQVTAYQTGHNDPGPPTELPYGTQLGRLTVDTKTLTVSLAVPE